MCEECLDEWIATELPTTESVDGTSPAPSSFGIEICDALVSYFSHSSVG